MKNKLIPIITVVLLVVGCAVLLYPTIGNLINKMTASVAVSGYKSAVDEMDDEEIEKKLEAASKYNELLSSADGANFSGGKNASQLSEYKEYFTVDEILGFISIPKADIYLPIYAGDAEKALSRGVWLMDNTSIPIGGESTHSGLSGHRGLPSAELFTNLDKLEEGDMFYIYVMNKSLAYRVDDIRVVLPEEADSMNIIRGGDFVTLVTCTPYGVNTHRLLVRGERTEYTDGEDNHSGLLRDDVKLVPWIALGISAAVIIIPVIIVKSRRNKRRRRSV